MNLIEQLAGYGECERLSAVPAASSFRIRGIEFTREELERAMLEHRRQHNIFEIDDYVVNEYPDTIEAVFQVETLTPKLKKPKTLRCGRWGNYPVGCNSVRHATPEEIKAGRRL